MTEMNEMYEMQELQKSMEQPMKTYKDRVFRMLFKQKEHALELYNAMNNTEYTNPDDIFITTLENAIYMGMKNDVSFVLYDRLMLYEHQASRNPNMPLRDLFYVSHVYSRLTADKYLYGSTLITLPEPKFVVFYNGKDNKMPEREELLLSNAYEHPTGDPALELKVLVLNINPGFNEELKSHCQTLCEYMQFVDTVRKYRKKMDFPEAMKYAIDECIKNGILEEFLRQNRAEVETVGIFEYDEEKFLEYERNEAEKRGEARGEARLSQLLNTLLTAGKLNEAQKATTDEVFREQLYTEYGL